MTSLDESIKKTIDETITDASAAPLADLAVQYLVKSLPPTLINRHIIFIDSDIQDVDQFIKLYLSHADNEEYDNKGWYGNMHWLNNIKTLQRMKDDDFHYEHTSDSDVQYIYVPIKINDLDDLVSRNLHTEYHIDQYMNSKELDTLTQSYPFSNYTTYSNVDTRMKYFYEKPGIGDVIIIELSKILGIITFLSSVKSFTKNIRTGIKNFRESSKAVQRELAQIGDTASETCSRLQVKKSNADKRLTDSVAINKRYQEKLANYKLELDNFEPAGKGYNKTWTLNVRGEKVPMLMKNIDIPKSTIFKTSNAAATTKTSKANRNLLQTAKIQDWVTGETTESTIKLSKSKALAKRTDRISAMATKPDSEAITVPSIPDVPTSPPKLNSLGNKKVKRALSYITMARGILLLVRKGFKIIKTMVKNKKHIKSITKTMTFTKEQVKNSNSPAYSAYYRNAISEFKNIRQTLIDEYSRNIILPKHAGAGYYTEKDLTDIFKPFTGNTYGDYGFEFGGYSLVSEDHIFWNERINSSMIFNYFDFPDFEVVDDIEIEKLPNIYIEGGFINAHKPSVYINEALNRNPLFNNFKEYKTSVLTSTSSIIYDPMLGYTSYGKDEAGNLLGGNESPFKSQLGMYSQTVGSISQVSMMSSMMPSMGSLGPALTITEFGFTLWNDLKNLPEPYQRLDSGYSSLRSGGMMSRPDAGDYIMAILAPPSPTVGTFDNTFYRYGLNLINSYEEIYDNIYTILTPYSPLWSSNTRIFTEDDMKPNNDDINHKQNNPSLNIKSIHYENINSMIDIIKQYNYIPDTNRDLYSYYYDKLRIDRSTLDAIINVHNLFTKLPLFSPDMTVNDDDIATFKKLGGFFNGQSLFSFLHDLRKGPLINSKSVTCSRLYSEWVKNSSLHPKVRIVFKLFSLYDRIIGSHKQAFKEFMLICNHIERINTKRHLFSLCRDIEEFIDLDGQLVGSGDIESHPLRFYNYKHIHTILDIIQTKGPKLLPGDDVGYVDMVKYKYPNIDSNILLSLLKIYQHLYNMDKDVFTSKDINYTFDMYVLCKQIRSSQLYWEDIHRGRDPNAKSTLLLHDYISNVKPEILHNDYILYLNYYSVRKSLQNVIINDNSRRLKDWSTFRNIDAIQSHCFFAISFLFYLFTDDAYLPSYTDDGAPDNGANSSQQVLREGVLYGQPFIDQINNYKLSIREFGEIIHNSEDLFLMSRSVKTQIPYKYDYIKMIKNHHSELLNNSQTDISSDYYAYVLQEEQQRKDNILNHHNKYINIINKYVNDLNYLLGGITFISDRDYNPFFYHPDDTYKYMNTTMKALGDNSILKKMPPSIISFVNELRNHYLSCKKFSSENMHIPINMIMPFCTSSSASFKHMHNIVGVYQSTLNAEASELKRYNYTSPVMEIKYVGNMDVPITEENIEIFGEGIRQNNTICKYDYEDMTLDNMLAYDVPKHNRHYRFLHNLPVQVDNPDKQINRFILGFYDYYNSTELFDTELSDLSISAEEYDSLRHRVRYTIDNSIQDTTNATYALLQDEMSMFELEDTYTTDYPLHNLFNGKQNDAIFHLYEGVFAKQFDTWLKNVADKYKTYPYITIQDNYNDSDTSYRNLNQLKTITRIPNKFIGYHNQMATVLLPEYKNHYELIKYINSTNDKELMKSCIMILQHLTTVTDAYYEYQNYNIQKRHKKIFNLTPFLSSMYVYGLDIKNILSGQFGLYLSSTFYDLSETPELTELLNVINHENNLQIISNNLKNVVDISSIPKIPINVNRQTKWPSTTLNNCTPPTTITIFNKNDINNIFLDNNQNNSNDQLYIFIPLLLNNNFALPETSDFKTTAGSSSVYNPMILRNGSEHNEHITVKRYSNDLSSTNRNDILPSYNWSRSVTYTMTYPYAHANYGYTGSQYSGMIQNTFTNTTTIHDIATNTEATALILFAEEEPYALNGGLHFYLNTDDEKDTPLFKPFGNNTYRIYNRKDTFEVYLTVNNNFPILDVSSRETELQDILYFKYDKNSNQSILYELPSQYSNNYAYKWFVCGCTNPINGSSGIIVKLYPNIQLITTNNLSENLEYAKLHYTYPYDPIQSVDTTRYFNSIRNKTTNKISLDTNIYEYISQHLYKLSTGFSLSRWTHEVQKYINLSDEYTQEILSVPSQYHNYSSVSLENPPITGDYIFIINYPTYTYPESPKISFPGDLDLNGIMNNLEDNPLDEFITVEHITYSQIPTQVRTIEYNGMFRSVTGRLVNEMTSTTSSISKKYLSNFIRIYQIKMNPYYDDIETYYTNEGKPSILPHNITHNELILKNYFAGSKIPFTIAPDDPSPPNTYTIEIDTTYKQLGDIVSITRETHSETGNEFITDIKCSIENGVKIKNQYDLPLMYPGYESKRLFRLDFPETSWSSKQLYKSLLLYSFAYSSEYNVLLDAIPIQILQNVDSSGNPITEYIQIKVTSKNDYVLEFRNKIYYSNSFIPITDNISIYVYKITEIYCALIPIFPSYYTSNNTSIIQDNINIDSALDTYISENNIEIVKMPYVTKMSGELRYNSEMQLNTYFNRLYDRVAFTGNDYTDYIINNFTQNTTQYLANGTRYGNADFEFTVYPVTFTNDWGTFTKYVSENGNNYISSGGQQFPIYSSRVFCSNPDASISDREYYTIINKKVSYNEPYYFMNIQDNYYWIDPYMAITMNDPLHPIPKIIGYYGWADNTDFTAISNFWYNRDCKYYYGSFDPEYLVNIYNESHNKDKHIANIITDNIHDLKTNQKVTRRKIQ